MTGPASLGPTVADIAQGMLEQLQRLRRQKEVDDALMPLVRDLSMAAIETLRELRVASHAVIDAWRSASLADPDQVELRAAIEALVEVSGWQRGDGAPPK